MGIFDAIMKNVFGTSYETKLMKTITKPVFIKDFIKESEDIIKLNQLLNNATDEEVKKKILKELNLQRYVQEGLNKVYFELNNSPIPFYALSNIRLEQQDNSSDIDFLLITHQFCCIIKCKSLQGNIEIDSQCSFYRWVKKNEKWSKEGIYSPIEQNRRAELALKNILGSKLNINNMPILSLTVFTNAKATLNFKQCPEEIKDKVIKVDILNTKLKELVENTAIASMDEGKALLIAEALKGMDCSKNKDYSKLENIMIKTIINDTDVKKVVDKSSPSEDKERLIIALKGYRTATAKANSIPPYFIYNNEEMEKIVEALPKTKEEFLLIKGFGEVKFSKYGEDILNIIKGVLS
jgi:hypothetical protein